MLTAPCKIAVSAEKGQRLVEFVPIKSNDSTLKADIEMLEARMSQAALRDFSVEYSKTNRAKCRHCEMPISRANIRVKKTVYDTEIGMQFSGEPLWHHLICFAKVRNSLGWQSAGQQLPGYASLNRTDQQIIDKLIM